jgi:hypothetical protein
MERTGELKFRGAGTLKAAEERLAAEEPVSLQDAIKQVKWDPFLFLGVAPLIAWVSLIYFNPELRVQMNEKWRETTSDFFSPQEDGAREATPQLAVDPSRSSSDQPACNKSSGTPFSFWESRR